jgi:anti-anti-sigma regulatory factor
LSTSSRGEIDLRAGWALLARGVDLAGSQFGDVGLDLSEVSFIDSTGLCSLLMLRGIVETGERRLRLVGSARGASAA